MGAGMPEPIYYVYNRSAYKTAATSHYDSVWVDKIFTVVMKKRSLVATLCRDENCAMTSRGNLFNRHR